jgi:RNA polymerase sigma factor (sigma-70 family)
MLSSVMSNANKAVGPPFPCAGPEVFATTHWTVVLLAAQRELPQAAKALECLCRAYWYPLYVFVRRQGYSPEDAQDLTQDFFSRVLEKNYFAMVAPERGKFRTFLLRSLKNFMVNEWKRAGRLKRGGGVEFISIDTNLAEDRYATEPGDQFNPDAAYEQRWAVTLIEHVLAAVQEEFIGMDKGRMFEELKGFVWGGQDQVSYAEIAGRLDLSEGAVKVAASSAVSGAPASRSRSNCRTAGGRG